MDRQTVKEELIRLMNETHHRYNGIVDDSGLGDEAEQELATNILDYLDRIEYNASHVQCFACVTGEESLEEKVDREFG